MSEGAIIILIGVIVVIAAGLCIWAAAVEDARERDAWQAFVEANDCRVVEHKDGETGTAMGPAIGFDGTTMFSVQQIRTANQECWLCANGQRYWKKAGLAVRKDTSGS